MTAVRAARAVRRRGGRRPDPCRREPWYLRQPSWSPSPDPSCRPWSCARGGLDALNAISVGSRDAFEARVAATGARAIEPLVSHQFPFERFRDACACLAEAAHQDKIAIRF